MLAWRVKLENIDTHKIGATIGDVRKKVRELFKVLKIED